MEQILHLINEMAPYLLLGFLFAGLLHAFVPKGFFNRYLSKNSFSSVVYAALLGIPLPLCSCGVIPTAMSLRKEGASRGAVTSFLIATPQTGVDSIIATAAMLGIPFAVIRPVAALVTALFGGSLVNVLTRGEASKPEQEITKHEEHDKAHEEEKPHCCCCCKKEEPKKEEPKEEERHDCCHTEHHETIEKRGCWARLQEALRYAFIEMVGDIGKWLVIGLVVAALITVFVSDDFFAVFKDNTLLSMLLVLAISIPMYICATGSIPIAVALMAKGLTPGAALVLLMAGPAANFASILVLRSKLGTRTLIAYILSIVIGAIACGLVIDYALPRGWFTGYAKEIIDCCEPSQWWEMLSTVVLLALLLYNLVLRHKKPGCRCHD